MLHSRPVFLRFKILYTGRCHKVGLVSMVAVSTRNRECAWSYHLLKQVGEIAT